VFEVVCHRPQERLLVEAAGWWSSVTSAINLYKSGVWLTGARRVKGISAVHKVRCFIFVLASLNFF
jgi:hypothetical protein